MVRFRVFRCCLRGQFAVKVELLHNAVALWKVIAFFVDVAAPIDMGVDAVISDIVIDGKVIEISVCQIFRIFVLVEVCAFRAVDGGCVNLIVRVAAVLGDDELDFALVLFAASVGVCRFVRVAGRRIIVPAAAGSQGKQHHRCQQKRNDLFHILFSPKSLNYASISVRSICEAPASSASSVK